MEGAAQPALLYLVPFTLIPLFILAFIRRNYHSLWNGPEKVSLSLILNDNEQQQQQQQQIPSSSSNDSTVNESISS